MSADSHRGALDAVERIVNRGGDPRQVLDDVCAVLARLYPRVSIDLPDSADDDRDAFAIELGGRRVGVLRVGGADDPVFLARVATLVSAYARDVAGND